jgi:uncharacterized protein YgbK (DUF1537 family)
MSDLLLTYYGDDFTGSTDALEALTLGGVPSVLFLEPPTRAFLDEHFPGARAVGVAGTSRAMTPDQMDAALPPIFTALRELGAPLCHYKVCSTFDSSPTIGSIGRALDIGHAVFKPAFVPIVVGAPALKRYVAFGNLFATVRGETIRLDRHPTMRRHPVTPMDESDLRMHLARQTTRSIGLVDLLHLAHGHEAIDAQLSQLMRAGNTAILFDTLDDEHLMKIGRAIQERAAHGRLFVVGSSGVEYALVAAWRACGEIPASAPLMPPGPVAQIVVMSGSASPVTAEQIAWAEANGFHCMRLDVARLLGPATVDATCAMYCRAALQALKRGESVLLYSARGPDDPALAEAKALDAMPESVGQRLGTAQGRLLRSILEKTDISRICIAGGDTCGQVVQQLGIFAMAVCARLDPGGPLCRAYAHLPRVDGLELSLKGGQVGMADYFGRVRDGR